MHVSGPVGNVYNLVSEARKMAGLKGIVGASQGFSNSGEVHTELSRGNLYFLTLGGFGAVLEGGLCWFKGVDI